MNNVGGGLFAGMPAAGGSPSQTMQQVQASPYTAAPNPAPLPVQSTANSAPGAQAQASTPGTTTPAIQQANPQMGTSALRPSMGQMGVQGSTAPSARQAHSGVTTHIGNMQGPNGDGRQPWQIPMSHWNQQRGGYHFADGGDTSHPDITHGNVHGNPNPTVWDHIREIFAEPAQPHPVPWHEPHAHGGHFPQAHEHGALGALAPDMSSPPDHMGNSRHNYTGNMTQSSGRADDINAKLANNEYIMDAETTALAGDGNPDEGARRFDKLREEIRKHKGKALAKGKISPNAKPRLSAYNHELVR